VAYRAKYISISAYAAATAAPSVVKGNVATSDVYYSGTLLSEAVKNITKPLTNGSGVYCMVNDYSHSLFNGLADWSLDGTRG
jgi:purine nucleoside permease